MKKTIFFIFLIFLANIAISQINFGEKMLPASATKVFSVDLDGDNDNDIILNNEWSENIDGLGIFGNPINIHFVAPSSDQLFSCDIDGDNDNDIITLSNTLHWFENTDGNGSFTKQHIFGHFTTCFYICDMDNDNDNDILFNHESGLIQLSKTMEQEILFYFQQFRVLKMQNLFLQLILMTITILM